MDMQQMYSYGVNGVNLSSDSSHDSTPMVPDWIITPMKFGIGGSPNSPLSSQFDCDTFTTPCNSQEQCSSTENLSGVSPACNSFETDSYYQTNPSTTYYLNDQERQGSMVFRDMSGPQNMKLALEEIESALMSPDINEDEATTMGHGDFHGYTRPENLNQRSRPSYHGSPVSQPATYITPKQQKTSHGLKAEKRHRATEEPRHEIQVPQGNLKKLLIECARALSENRMDDFDKLVEHARSAVSVSGDPIQRLGAYMVEGLVARKRSSGAVIYGALNCKQPEGKDLLSYMRLLYEICPYMKFGYMAANGAIAEAFRNEDRVHIIDFQIAQGTQWITLIQALAARPGGPPHVRITGIDDPVSQYARGDGLAKVGSMLALMSEKFKIPVEFHPVPVFASDVTREMLNVKHGEAVAVNFPLQLHHTPDESVDVTNPRDMLLRMVKSLSPKVVTLIEQESNTNTTPFLMRFMEALDFYSAMFESIDTALGRETKERIKVEEQCLARDIVNVIACEGRERVERHELLGKWRVRFEMAGFRPFPLSSHVNLVIRGLVKSYSQSYTLVETDGAMLLGWQNRNLISASAWC
ncbi:hypothetical protein MKW94_030884 [Papaver nudicaule]|uniref:Uncharacterized protein n=1 Tax=Papaver nudicaule TaxID=74823 RepID=A0AA42B1F1_PAPNU|nr:hypothetical protein [Papaver nudicaule]